MSGRMLLGSKAGLTIHRSPGASTTGMAASGSGCSGQMCMNNPVYGYKISFTYDVDDLPDQLYEEFILNEYDSIKANPLDLATTPIPSLTENSVFRNIQLETPCSLVGVPYQPLSTLDDAKWLFIVKLFAFSFSFSPNRIVNVIIDPKYSNNIITSIDVEFTIANFVQNLNNSPVKPGPDSALINDKQSAVCLGMWIIDNLNRGIDIEFLANTPITNDITNQNVCMNNNKIISELGVDTNYRPANRRRITRTPSSTHNVIISNFSNVRGGIINKNNIVEYFQVNTANSGPVNVAPRSIFDYLFMFSYLISFVGAIFFAMASLVQIDPSTLIANKNVSFALNLFIGVCGAISMLIWINGDTNFDALYLVGLNSAVVKQKI